MMRRVTSLVARGSARKEMELFRLVWLEYVHDGDNEAQMIVEDVTPNTVYRRCDVQT